MKNSMNLDKLGIGGRDWKLTGLIAPKANVALTDPYDAPSTYM